MIKKNHDYCSNVYNNYVNCFQHRSKDAIEDVKNFMSEVIFLVNTIHDILRKYVLKIFFILSLQYTTSDVFEKFEYKVCYELCRPHG